MQFRVEAALTTSIKKSVWIELEPSAVSINDLCFASAQILHGR